MGNARIKGWTTRSCNQGQKPASKSGKLSAANAWADCSSIIIDKPPDFEIALPTQPLNHYAGAARSGRQALGREKTGKTDCCGQRHHGASLTRSPGRQYLRLNHCPRSSKTRVYDMVCSWVLGFGMLVCEVP